MSDLQQWITTNLDVVLVRYKQFKSRRHSFSSKTKMLIMLLAFLFLAGGVFFSISANPLVLKALRWQWVWVIFLVGVPLTVLFNALEFMISARMISVKVSAVKALEVTIIGSAANMLPLPGSTMVRVAALKLSGAGYKQSTLVTLLVAVVWIGTAFLYAGLVLLFFSNNLLGYLLAAVGAVTLVVSSLLVRYAKIQSLEYLKLLVVKFGLVLTDALRIYLCFWAINIAVDFAQASVFVVSGVLGSAASIIPAGLGVRELLSAGIAPIIGIGASVAFLTATLNRVVGLSSLLPVAGLLILFERKYKK